MIKVRESQDRGHANHGWLDSYHTFSFGSYYDLDNISFRCLRVINEDRIEGGAGFPSHPHSDMEILTYVVSGELSHKDSMGNQETIKPGEIQRMSAGTGVVHSEFSSSENVTHLLQIWIISDKRGYSPSYQQKDFSKQCDKNCLTLAVSPDGHSDSLTIHQNMQLFIGHLLPYEKRTYAFQDKRYGWIQVVKGKMEINNTIVHAGDGVEISDEILIEMKGIDTSEFLLFDLP